MKNEINTEEKLEKFNAKAIQNIAMELYGTEQYADIPEEDIVSEEYAN